MNPDERPEADGEEEEEDSFDPHLTHYDESTPFSEAAQTYSSYSTISSNSIFLPSPSSSHPYANNTNTPPMSPTQADVDRFALLDHETENQKEEEDSSSGDEKDDDNPKGGKKKIIEEEEEEDVSDGNTNGVSDGNNPLDWHPMFSTPNNNAIKQTGGNGSTAGVSEAPPDLISTVASPDEHESYDKQKRKEASSHGLTVNSSSSTTNFTSILSPHHNKTINSITFDEYRELQHSLDKANEQISLLKSRLSGDGRRSTIEKEKLERAQLTAKIETLKGKIEEMNYQILYGNSQKDKEIQSLKAEITKLKISQTRARISASGTGERGSFSLDSTLLSPTPSTASTSIGSSETPYTPLTPASTPPHGIRSTDLKQGTPSTSDPLFLDFDKQVQSSAGQTLTAIVQERKKREDMETALKQAKETIDEYKSKMLDLEAAYVREKELRASDRETWSRLLQEKETELRKSQAMERTLAGMETYVDIRRLRGLAGMMFCCTDLDLDF